MKKLIPIEYGLLESYVFFAAESEWLPGESLDGKLLFSPDKELRRIPSRLLTEEEL